MDTTRRLTMEEALEKFPSLGDALCAGCDIIVGGKIIIFGASCPCSKEDADGKRNLKIYPGKKKEKGSCHDV